MKSSKNYISDQTKNKARNSINKKILDDNNRIFKVIHKDSNVISGLSLIVSVIAICATVYFQIFFENNETSASFINGTIKHDTTLIAHIIYNNRGNRYATILRNTIIFYQKEDSVEKNESNGIKFNSKSERIYDDELDPIVMSPGQQLYRKLNQSIDFKNIDFKTENINPRDTIQIGLIVGFLSPSGYHSSNILKMGWLKLDTVYKIKNWSFHFINKKLESDSYWSDTSSK